MITSVMTLKYTNFSNDRVNDTDFRISSLAGGVTTMLGAYPRHRHHEEAVSDNEQEMSTISMHVEDTRSQTSRTLEARPGREETADRPSSLLRIIKWIALGLIALCVCGGAVLSKVSLASITGKFFDLTASQDDPDRWTRGWASIAIKVICPINVHTYPSRGNQLRYMSSARSDWQNN